MAAQIALPSVEASSPVFLMAALLKIGMDIGARNDRSGANNGSWAYYRAAFVSLDVDRSCDLPLPIRLFLKMHCRELRCALRKCGSCA